MLDDLLASATEQAERSMAPVRAAALLRVARVETALNPSAARNTFDRGLDAIRELPDLENEFLLEQAALIAAAVAPDLLSGTPRLIAPHMFEDTLLDVMLDHGHLEPAVTRFLHHEDTTDFPFGMIHVVMRRIGDEGVRLALLRRAIEAWRHAPPYDPMKPPDGEFIQLFQSEWKAIPPAEALTLVREIVRVTIEQPEQSITATYADGAVVITSWRAHVFFQVLHILRHLDPDLAGSLTAEHRQLADAARRFPKGRESMDEEAESRRKNRPPGGPGGRIMMGSPEEFPYLESLHKSGIDGDFGPPVAYALEKYRKDSNPKDPNRAPREFWPSTCTYRRILYGAGKRLGSDASVYLERVPDDDLRLFAQIELVAALAGLPQFRDIQREYKPRQSAAPKIKHSR
ncbi:MAG TPA: hypothetical protein VG273_18290 [Bryobacteraceae bacterium]|jgi:hypothetical protein|nr:hypothetical protein [Bryobacteraceae bacterium]